MVELFRNPKINWLDAKKFFIGITILLLLVGAIAVQLRGFNLGVDFTGGTLMTVRFKEQPPLDQIRSALALAHIDTSKVTLQPVTSRPNELIIHSPQLDTGTEAERRVDQDKRAIIGAMQRLNPAGDIAAGKANINGVDAAGIEAELRQVDPLGIKAQYFPSEHPYRQVGDQIISLRNGPNKGFLQDIAVVQSLTLTAKDSPNFDQNAVKPVLMDRFYAGKIDLNLAGRSEIEELCDSAPPVCEI